MDTYKGDNDYEGIYLDNGATSFPKAPGVVESRSNFCPILGQM